jgi:hypothetical protein
MLGTQQIVRPLERTRSVPDKIGFMMARTANHAGTFLITPLG